MCQRPFFMAIPFLNQKYAFIVFAYRFIYCPPTDMILRAIAVWLCKRTTCPRSLPEWYYLLIMS